MAKVHRKGKAPVTRYSYDQVYAGVEPMAHCRCGDTASVHICTYQRSKLIAVKCENCKTCDNFYPVIELPRMRHYVNPQP